MKMLCGVWDSQNIVLHSVQRLHSALLNPPPLHACLPNTPCACPGIPSEALMELKNNNNKKNQLQAITLNIYDG